MEKSNHILAEAILRVAVIEDHERELAKLAMLDNSAPHSSFSDAHEKRMKKLFRSERFHRRMKTTGRMFYRLTATLMVIMGLASLSLLFSEEVRAIIPNVLIEWFDDHTDFNFNVSEVETEDKEWKLTNVPKEYEQVFYRYKEGKTDIVYQLPSGEDIVFWAFPISENLSIGVDNEHYEYYEILDDGINYRIFDPISQDYPCNILWESEGYSFYLCVYDGVEATLSMAKSIQEK